MNSKTPKLSIIVPVLNEADQLYTLLHHLYQQMNFPEQAEVLLIDGGSTDGSAEEFHRYHNQHKEFNIQWINSSEKGRAVQMNLGAQKAAGAIFYFLHADSLPPVGFDALIYKEVERDNQAGCFRMRFDSSHWWLHLAGWLTRLNWKICRGGDQSQFITRELFESIGGFDESYRIFEDNMLIEALYKRGQFTVIPKTLVTSCRRYEKTGIWKLQYHFWMIQFKHRRGAGPEHLYAYYQKHLAK